MRMAGARVLLLLMVVWLVLPQGWTAEPPAGAAVPDPASRADGAARATAAADEARIARALVEALRIGIDRVTARLGRPGGFVADPAVRIPLPGGLEPVRAGLAGAGLGQLVVELELRMNRAAEAAMPAADRALGAALAALAIEDAGALLHGADDAATRHFAAAMAPALVAELTPIIETELHEAGAVDAFEAFVEAYAALPLMPSIRGDLTAHVVEATLAGLFHYLAEEERAIRKDPRARSTALLRRVFGDG